jgi:hypothetical protein
MRDHILSSHRFVVNMKFIPENRKIFVIQEVSHPRIMCVFMLIVMYSVHSGL